MDPPHTYLFFRKDQRDEGRMKVDFIRSISVVDKSFSSLVSSKYYATGASFETPKF